jgi:hypothetical protein
MSRHRTSPYRLIEISEWHPLLDAELPLADLAVVMFLRTGPASTRLPGLVSLGVGALADDLGVTAEALEEPLARLDAAGILHVNRRRRVFYLPGVLPRNLPAHANEARGMAADLAPLHDCDVVGLWLAELASLPQSRRRDLLTDAVKGLRDQFAGSWPEAWSEGRSEGRPEGRPKTEAEAHAHAEGASPAPGNDGVTFECRDGVEVIDRSDLSEWASAYPALDVAAQVRRAAIWCEAQSPSKRWTRRGVRRAVIGWLNRSARVHEARPDRDQGRGRQQVEAYEDLAAQIGGGRHE